MTTHRKKLVGAAVASVSRASTGTITIEGGKGGVLTALEFQVLGVVAAGGIDLGGLVELECDAREWKPFKFYTNSSQVLTTGGVVGKVLRIPVHKDLPAGSTITVWYTPYTTDSQKLAVCLHWETDLSFSPSKETFAMGHLGTAADCGTAAVDPHNTITIPAEKGGVCRAIMVNVLGVVTSVKDTGGELELKNPSAKVSWEPFHIVTTTYTCITDGGWQKEQQVIPCKLDLPARSVVTSKYKAQHTVNTNISLTLIWTRS